MLKRKSLLLAIVLLLSLFAGVFSACDTVSDALTVDFYAINDFHGETDKISTVCGYLSQEKYHNENVVLINSGDMFQGSIASNSNYGNLLSDCIDEVGFDCLTLGNHEFDWGLEKLAALSAQSATPFLGANVYHWDANQRTWGTFADELAQEYVIKTLPNGLKIGIIGVIGESQITSISSNLVQTIGFKSPSEVIPQLSQTLRNKHGCDVVVVSAHTGQETFLEDTEFDITQYADAVFCAHTHKQEIDYKNNVPFVQGGSSGTHVSHVQLSVDASGNVSCKEYENIRYSESWPNLYSVQQLINNSNESIVYEANQIMATLSGKLSKSKAVPRLVCHAMAQYALSQGHEIDLAMCNTARADLPSGEITYAQLYDALPFDNVVYVARVRGSDILNQAKFSQIWRVTENAIEYNKVYTIAVIDYLLLHQNANRNYNYFRSAFELNQYSPLVKSGYQNYNYRLITRDFLLSAVNVDCSLYTQNNNHTDVDKLGSSVKF